MVNSVDQSAFDGPGSTELPAYCLGHVGYSVVSWKRRRGYATRALRLLLPYARAEGLPCIELTTDADNLPSRRVIEANGETLVEQFKKPVQHGGADSLRFRIVLTVSNGGRDHQNGVINGKKLPFRARPKR